MPWDAAEDLFADALQAARQRVGEGADKYAWRGIMTPKQMGHRLKALRKDRDLSRQALAEKAGISREYIRLLDAGRYDPTVGMLQRLARALGVKVTDLLK